MRSLTNKLPVIEDIILKQNYPDVIILTETWLLQNECDLYNIKNYQAFHHCRESRRGGTSIYIKDGMVATIKD